MKRDANLELHFRKETQRLLRAQRAWWKERASLRSALEALLSGYCEKWCPPPLRSPGEYHNAHCSKARQALGMAVLL